MQVISARICKKLIIRAILYNWQIPDQIEAGFSLKNRPKRAENMHLTIRLRLIRNTVFLFQIYWLVTRNHTFVILNLLAFSK